VLGILDTSSMGVTRYWHTNIFMNQPNNKKKY
jgi:hypothetical protein